MIERFYEDYVEISATGQNYVAVVFVSPECAEHLNRVSVVDQFKKTISMQSDALFTPFDQFAIEIDDDGESKAKRRSSASVTICYILKPTLVTVCTHPLAKNVSKKHLASVRDFSAVFCDMRKMSGSERKIAHNRHEFQILINHLLCERNYLYLMKKIEHG
jgi:hypothetical protein